MARTGGILTFIMFAAVALAMLLGFVAGEAPALGAVALVLNLVGFVLWFAVMILLKVNLDRNGYRKADVLVWAIIVLTLVMIAVAIVGPIAGTQQAARSGAGSPTNPTEILRALGPWAVAVCVAALILMIAFLMLGVRLNEYGASAGGVWKGAGIVLIVATCVGVVMLAIYIITLLTQMWGLAIVATVLAFMFLLIWAAVWILVGAGFMSDASRSAAAGEAGR